ncbi:MAG TPA: ComEC/Rec2 family competence protein [Niabella sp.]|nr:ComEC/Rec2 family competence protein [Niabella sp.]
MFLRRNPVIRLLLPLAIGIMIQWYGQAPFCISTGIFIACMLFFLFMEKQSDFSKLKYAGLQGSVMVLAAISCGMLLTYDKDVRHRQSWLGHTYNQGEILVAALKESPVVKEKSYKATAAVTYIMDSAGRRPSSGNIIIYFKKDSNIRNLKAGARLLFKKPLQEIHNTRNPGGFNFRQYALFNGITHQVYLTPNDYKILPGKDIVVWKSMLLKAREYVLHTIKTNIKGKREQGLAEAMLIGYRDDLDKDLLQSYTNTGVVHVIAVSGMHLSLLYWVISLLLHPLLKKRSARWLYAILVLCVLWGFSFIAGGAASVVRAAVMFSFITIGKLINRNASIYNILAASAFCQLVYNPYWLWDVGFQLSYIAVLSIILFYKPVCSLLYIKNPMLNKVWQLAAVSIAAQILTTPLSIYYFHQFPVYFLLANMVVVPVSSVVLVGTLILVMVAPVKILAAITGTLLNALIWWLNTFIERMETFPFALWEGLQINVFQAVLMLLIIAGLGFWLIEKYKAGFWFALTGLLVFFSMRSYSFLMAGRQQKLIVYNASNYAATDLISGRQYFYIGSEELSENEMLSAYILKPSRVLHRVAGTGNPIATYKNSNAVLFKKKKVFFINSPLKKAGYNEKLNIDVVILSGNPRLYISELLEAVNPQQIVIDGSVPAKKAGYWVNDCRSSGISCHNVSEDGAFVMSLD